MFRIILKSLFVVLLAVGIGTYLTGAFVGYELKRGNQPTGFSRELSDKENWKLYLFEQVTKRGLSYKQFRLLDRIAECESNWRQFENDKVFRGIVNPHDTGIFMISETFWLDVANELNYNIYEPYGNINMALYIYEKQGQQPWFWSKKCWGM